MAPTSATNNAGASSNNRIMYLVMGLGFVGAFMLGGIANEQEAFQISDMNLKSSVSQSAGHVWNTVTSFKSSAGSGSSDFAKKVKDASTTQKKKGQSKMNQERIDAVRTEVKTVLDMLDKYYKVDAALITAKEMLVDQGWSRGWDFSKPANHTKPTREMKLIDTMARALVDPTQDTFMIGTIGSSVAAGHDNCVYDSYENQLHRTFSKVWEAASMKLEVQNAGQGGGCGDSHQNQAWCIQQNVSPFVDIIHYSWTYFEAGQSNGKVERESLVRWAQLMPRQPPVHALNVGGVQQDKLKPGDVQRCYNGEGDLFDGYEDYGHNAFCMRDSIVNMWKNKSKSCFQGGFVGDFLHTTTRYGEIETNKERKNSLGVVMRNWHPGPLGFQTVADAFTYTYSLAILGALDLIEEALHAKKDIVKLWTNERPVVLKSHFRDPIHCDPLYCTVEEAPTCLNYELPTFGWYGASLTPTDDNLNPYRGELQNWTVWHEGGSPFRMVPKADQVVYASTPEYCTFPDHCGGLSATHGQEGRAVFKLPKMEVGLLVLCGCCGKEVGKDMFLENEFIEIEFNNERLHNNTWDIWPNGKCVRLLKTHLEDGADIGNNGHSYLSIKVKPGLKAPIRISHVITH